MNLSPDVLLLAAGRATRFGSNKLHAPFADSTILGTVLRIMSEARQAGVAAGALVVYRADDLVARNTAEAAGCRCIANEWPEAGLAASLRLGLEQLAVGSAPAALILLADQPRLQLDTIAALVHAWRTTSATCLRPRYAGEPDAPGHPVLLARSAWHLTGSLTGDRGLAPLFEQGLLRPFLVDVPGTNPDIDTPSDLEALRGHA